MPSFKITVQDTSPIISYSGDWRVGRSLDDDDYIDQYSQKSFTVTNATSAHVSFTFNGTSVGIYGAMRMNHGSYQVKLDDSSQAARNGSVPDPGYFKRPLFSVDNLVQGLHTVVLTNLEQKYLDIDFITWDTMIGTNIDDKLYVNTFQDTSPSFTYMPAETDWLIAPKYPGSFVGGSGHATTKPGASLVYSFDGEKMPNINTNLFEALCGSTGDGVSLYGPVGPDGPPYVARMDGGPTTTLTANNEFYTHGSLLYHASSLGPGIHNLMLTHQPDDPRQTFAIDYAEVYTTTAPLSTTETGRPIGLIVGLTVSVVILTIFSGVMFTLFWRLHREQRKRKKSPPSVNPFHGVADAPGTDNSRSSITMLQTMPSSRQQGYGFYKRGLTFMNRLTAEQSSSTTLSTPDRVAGPSASRLPSPTIHPTPRSENPPEYTVNPFFE